MAVARKRAKMRRTQVSLTDEDYNFACRIAAQRHQSLSQVVREALRREAEAEEVFFDPLRGIIGIVKDDIPNASESIDEVVYGDDPH